MRLQSSCWPRRRGMESHIEGKIDLCVLIWSPRSPMLSYERNSIETLCDIYCCGKWYLYHTEDTCSHYFGLYCNIIFSERFTDCSHTFDKGQIKCPSYLLGISLRIMLEAIKNTGTEAMFAKSVKTDEMNSS